MDPAEALLERVSRGARERMQASWTRSGWETTPSLLFWTPAGRGLDLWSRSV